jgi:hypothetical protein
MTTHLRLLAGLAITLAGISANAQQTNRIEVTVPFAFSAAGNSMPAGQYLLTVNASNLVTLSGRAHFAAFFTVPGGQFGQAKDLLRFRQSATGWLLEQVAVSGATQQVRTTTRKRLTSPERACVSTPAISAAVQLSEIQSALPGKEN